MLTRFTGEDGQRRLREALKLSALIGGDAALADLIASSVTVFEVPAGSVLITEGASDDDLYLILSGEVVVYVHNREVARRCSGQYVGEMALIDPSAPRSATVVAAQSCVVGKISEPTFSKMADRAPVLWRRIALGLADRLRQRGVLVLERRERPQLFVGCSTESLPAARVIQDGLAYDPVTVRLWTDAVFGASSYTMDDLEKQLDDSDFAVLVLGPDDRVFSRGEEALAPRDNVILELGLFMGKLGRRRTYIVQPRGLDLKLPSNLLGLKLMTYSPGSTADLPAHLGPVCNELRRLINSLGPR